MKYSWIVNVISRKRLSCDVDVFCWFLNWVTSLAKFACLRPLSFATLDLELLVNMTLNLHTCQKAICDKDEALEESCVKQEV